MMKLSEIDLTWILIPIIIAGVIFSRISKFKTGNVLRDRLKNLEIATIMTGAVLLVLWICLPQTPSLSTFGYPEEVADINTPEKVLKYLQRYNDALVRVIDVVKFSLFIVIFWVIASALRVISAYKDVLDKDFFKQKDEKNL
jgi:hypothetical protein